MMALAPEDSPEPNLLNAAILILEASGCQATQIYPVIQFCDYITRKLHDFLTGTLFYVLIFFMGYHVCEDR